MSTHNVKVYIEVDVRVHVAHGLIGAAERRAIREAKDNAAGWIARRGSGGSAHRGDYSYAIGDARRITHGDV